MHGRKGASSKASQKDTAANYDLQTMIPRIFQQSRLELMTLKAGKDFQLPRGFDYFVTTPLCHDLCASILDYCKYLIKLDKKKK